MKRSLSVLAPLALAIWASAAEPPPVKVFILAGQSNMEGHGVVPADPKRNDGRGSLEHFAKGEGRSKRLLDADGKWVVRDDVWITYLDRRGPLAAGFGVRPDRIGPELGFGWVLGDALDEPVVLIKCAWGGKSLAIDFRPPSAGKVPESFDTKTREAVEKDPAIPGKYYRETLALTRAALAKLDELFPAVKGRGYELAGFGWHQGWNDRINEQFNAEYASNLAHFIRDMRRDLNAPNLPFVIAETGMNGPGETHPRALSLMKAQASVAELNEFKGTVAFVPTRSFWRDQTNSPSGQGYHWNSNGETYWLIGEAMGEAMKKLLPAKPGAKSAAVTRPKLQVINGSAQPIDVFWLESDSERVPNGTVAPGEDTIITTTLGHRFLIVGQSDKTERIVISKVPVQAVRFDPPDPDGIPAFYTQRVYARGYPIVASATVNPYALKEAVYLVDLLLAKRSDVREAMIQSGSRLCILAWNEFTTDQPEFAWLGERPVPEFPGVSARDFRDARARGMGGSATDPFCSCAEENLLGYPGDPYEKENILIHEFAHNIHLRGMANVDPAFDGRVKAAYEEAMAAGLWKGKYASVNHHEYFAEGVQSWFDDNRENDHDHNHVNTRAELIEYDPGLAALCREVFGDTELKYTKPATRLTGHMAGYDPSTAPKFVWPERLQEAKRQIRRAAEERNGRAANAPGGRETRAISGWQVHIRTRLFETERAATERALELLKRMLDEIVREVPAPAVAELRKVPLYFSPAYKPGRGGAEFHPDAGWLRDNGRDPGMARAVEFSGVHNFEAEMKRMPNFALHELAHAYHHRVLKDGFEHTEIKAAYERARAAGRYDRVERTRGDGSPNTFERAYAMTNPMEYFAEATEAFFFRNDFFPFTRDELRQHDPEFFALLARLWGAAEHR